jgi:FixJ family two-component response regulator
MTTNDEKRREPTIFIADDDAVIVITGYGDVPLAVRAMRAAAVDFVEKPFAEEEVLAAVDRALELG